MFLIAELSCSLRVTYFCNMFVEANAKNTSAKFPLIVSEELIFLDFRLPWQPIKSRHLHPNIIWVEDFWRDIFCKSFVKYICNQIEKNVIFRFSHYVIVMRVLNRSRQKQYYWSPKPKDSIWAASWQNQHNGMCTQRRLRSAWASAQSDQSLRCPHEENLGP